MRFLNAALEISRALWYNRFMTVREHKGKSLFALPDDYTVVDIETNGMTAGESEILEVSAIRFRNGRSTGVFSTLVRPKRAIDPFITRLTGITDGMAADAPEPYEVMRRFYVFVGSDVIIGHNVHFDVDFLYDGIAAQTGEFLTNDFVDTLRLSKKALPTLENHKLATVAAHYGISAAGAHRALRDCEICNACYIRLKSDILSAELPIACAAAVDNAAIIKRG